MGDDYASGDKRKRGQILDHIVSSRLRFALVFPFNTHTLIGEC